VGNNAKGNRGLSKVYLKVEIYSHDLEGKLAPIKTSSHVTHWPRWGCPPTSMATRLYITGLTGRSCIKATRQSQLQGVYQELEFFSFCCKERQKLRLPHTACISYVYAALQSLFFKDSPSMTRSGCKFQPAAIAREQSRDYAGVRGKERT
jgi:hypothetical protein